MLDSNPYMMPMNELLSYIFEIICAVSIVVAVTICLGICFRFWEKRNIRKLYIEHDSLHEKREKTLNETIKNLQTSLHKHQNNVQISNKEHKQREQDLNKKILQLEKKLQDETEKRKNTITKEKW